MKLLVVSSVLPKPTGFGETVLHRHLCNDARLTTEVVPAPAWPLTVRALRRLKLGALANSWELLRRGRRWDAPAQSPFERTRPDVIVTVAHGDGCHAALRLARQTGVPLVTFVHDWWPDISGLPLPLRSRGTQGFLEVCRNSTLAFCVSEGMCRALGNPPGCRVLYPIPAPATAPAARGSKPAAVGKKPFKVLYLGNLQAYAPMLRGALEALRNHPSLRLEVRGKWPQWPREFSQQMRSLGLWLDFAPRSELDAWLSTADAFLIPVPFDASFRRVMETAFPSKLLECIQFGKPLVVWGPEYSSAVRWAQNGARAAVVMDPNPKTLLSALESLAANPGEQERLGQQSVHAAATEFNPVQIQEQFVRALQSLVRPQTVALENSSAVLPRQETGRQLVSS